jgi:ABC-type glycerol-3-phosphate transport system substrate-binding protein
MKALRTLAVTLALLGTSPLAQAQVVDLSKTTCKDFLESGKDGIMIIWAWLYGYYADQDADPVVDFAKLTAQGTKLAEACKASPAKDIISVAETIYEAK